MNSRLKFFVEMMKGAPSTDSTGVAICETQSSSSQTGHGRGINTNNSFVSLLQSSESSSHGSGRAGLIRKLPNVQITNGIAQEQSRPDPIAGRGRFMQVVMSRAEHTGKEEASGVAEPIIETPTQPVAPAETPKQKSPAGSSEQVRHEPKECCSAEPIVRMGTSGSSTTLLCNFMVLQCDTDRGIFMYTVDFEPMVESKSERLRCLASQTSVFGKTYSFDGAMLLVPQALPQNHMVLKTTHTLNETMVTMTVNFRGKKRLGENVQFYNNLFRRIMGILQLTEIGRKNFDPTQARIVPQHKLEVWPGYVTAVNEFEGGLMLNLDITHRILMQTTVYDHIKLTKVASPERYRENLLKSLLGIVVFTRYNKKTYRIDDVLFDANPLSTFRRGNRDVTYVEYFKQQYDIDIMDHHQPLLLHRATRRVSGSSQPQESLVCLVPEICTLTGLTDEMRSDFKVMRDIVTYTSLTPNQRMAAMEQFCKNVNDNEAARTLLSSWGLKLSGKAKTLVGRTLAHENIQFGNNVIFSAGPLADFNNQASSTQMLEVVHVRNWMLVHTTRDSRAASSFVNCINRNCRLLGIEFSKPRIEILQQDSTQLYLQLLRTRVQPETQIIVIICPTSRDDRYAAIKRVCCTEVPVPTQIINVRTLMNDKRVRSIVMKIILQMNCKLGGTLWDVTIPLNNTMICGIDTYHETKRPNASVAAFVGSIDPAFTHWYSRAMIQKCKEEFMNGLCVTMENALRAYKRRNCQLPAKLIIFRDGVGDSQLVLCEEYEMQQLSKAFEMFGPDYHPKVTFIVVQKRINARMFSMNRSQGTFDNPPPGTVLDHTVTRRYRYDFFLISQSVRHGTVSPTHYIVLRDDSAFSPDILQRLSYKMCYMYYNWPGSIRVPACCQYAHKLAYLVGQSIKCMPEDSLCEKLFYL